MIGPRDFYASDYDYDAVMGHSYDAADWCLLHGQRRDSCGQCVSDELELDRAAALMAALDTIDEAQDEQMGAHFAARFGEGDKR